MLNFFQINRNEILQLFIALTVLPLNVFRPNDSVISAADIAFGKSCLLANTSNAASLNSSSCNYKCKYKCTS